MDLIRKQVLQCLEDHADDDEDIVAAVNRIAARHGEQVYAAVIEVLTNLDMTPEDAEKRWHQIVAHWRHLSSALGRKVRMQTALIDYFSSINKSIKNPKIVEMRHFERTALLSKYDSLTGLLNRHYFDEALAREISRAERHNLDLSVLFFDLDDFKRLNDYYGHIAGDTALREVGRIILEEKRDEDIAARYGGEEIVIILPETGKANTLALAERIRERVAGMKLQHHGVAMSLTISGGLASYPFDATSAANLLQDADAALYRAKDSGKNNIVLFSKDKRRHIRSSFFTRLQIKELGFNGTDTQTVQTKDISINGMRFESKHALAKGTKLQLNLSIKDKAPIVVVGIILRVDAVAPSRYDVGVSFLELDDPSRLAILCYLFQSLDNSSCLSR